MLATEETGTAEPGDGAEEPSMFDQLPGVDWLLVHQVSQANDYGLSTGITLFVGGLIVSGLIISGKTYMEKMAANQRAGTFPGVSDEYAKSIKDSLGRWYDTFAEAVYPKGEEGKPAPQLAKPGFIHLDNARIFAPGTKALPTGTGLLWRGKLASVDGFSLGMMSEA